MTHSRRLREKIELILPEFSDSATELVTHPDFGKIYPEFCVTVHWMIRSSVPLMQAALKRSHELADDDPVAAAMIPYLTQHIKEEMYHDEWLLQDLELLGYSRDSVLSRIPSAQVATSVGSRYYWILHHHPVAELGALAVMEGYPPSIDAIDYMEEHSGLPRAAFRTIEKHAHIDVHHRDELMAALDKMPFKDEHHELMGMCALHTAESTSVLYRNLLDEYEARNRVNSNVSVP